MPRVSRFFDFLRECTYHSFADGNGRIRGASGFRNLLPAVDRGLRRFHVVFLFPADAVRNRVSDRQSGRHQGKASPRAMMLAFALMVVTGAAGFAAYEFMR
jgi:hypothetical protein